MPAFCLGNQSPDYFPWISSGKQPWGASGQQPCWGPTSRPLAPAQHPSCGGSSVTAARGQLPPSPPRQRLDPPPGQALGGVFEAAPAIPAVSALSEAAAPAMSKPWRGSSMHAASKQGPAQDGKEVWGAGGLPWKRQKGRSQTYLKCRSLKVKWVSTMPVVFTLVRSTSCWVGM